MTTFDFTIDDDEKKPPLAPSDAPRGPSLNDVSNMTPKKFAKSILKVYNDLGGDQWLMTQAVLNPKTFMDLLKKILPTNLKLDGVDEMGIMIIDRFGDLKNANTPSNQNMSDLETVTGDTADSPVMGGDAEVTLQIAHTSKDLLH